MRDICRQFGCIAVSAWETQLWEPKTDQEQPEEIGQKQEHHSGRAVAIKE